MNRLRLSAIVKAFTGGTTGQVLTKTGSGYGQAEWQDSASGSVAWGDVTGKPSTFTPSAHGHTIADTSGLQTALDGKQAAIPWVATTVTLPSAVGVFDAEATVTAASCTPSSTIELRLASTADTDENEPEMLSLIAATAKPGSGSFALVLAFSELTSGPVKLQYRVA